MTLRIRTTLAALALWPIASIAFAQAPQASPAAPATATNVVPHDLEDFLRKPTFTRMVLSPKGTYIAVTVPVDDKTVLLVLKPGENKPYGIFNGSGKTHVKDVIWANDERLIFSIEKKWGALEQPWEEPDLWSMNADGSAVKQLAGEPPSTQVDRARSRSQREYVAVRVMRTLPDDDGYALVYVDRLRGGHPTVERMDVVTGLRGRPIAQHPKPFGGFALDQAGRPRYASTTDEEGLQVLYYRHADEGDLEWRIVSEEAKSGVEMTPLDFSPDGRTAYVQFSHPRGPDSIDAVDTVTGQRTQLARDDAFDPSGLVYAIGTRTPIGVRFDDPTPRYEYFAPDSAQAKLHRSVIRAFGGQDVYYSDFITPGNQVLIVAAADNEPGTAYLFDMANKRIDPIRAAAEWLKPERLGRMTGVSFKARDGRDIQALLTVPPGSSGKNLPLIINPHGGPFGVMDLWGYNQDVQILAAHGYAVLQVNFRGSGGLGNDHEIAGYQQWGLTMQDDLTDATQWAIAQGIADPKRICIYGASYGGYAALMGVAKEPNLYACAAGNVGVYELRDLPNEVNFSQPRLVAFFKRTFNSDPDAVSPTRMASRIRVPVFLSAGGMDQVAPKKHTDRMEAALKAAGVPVEYALYPTEGHGIYKLENNRDYYTRLLAFFARHLGGRTATPPTAAQAQAGGK